MEQFVEDEPAIRKWVEVKFDVFAGTDDEVKEAVADMMQHLGLPHGRELVKVEEY